MDTHNASCSARGDSSKLLEARQISIRYGSIEVLEGMDVSVTSGETVGILGHNGAGKSSLLRCLAGLVPCSRGQIIYRGEDITRWHVPQRVKEGIVLVPQGRALFREMSIRDNIRLGAFRRPSSEVENIWQKLSDRWSWLGKRQATFVGRLSGGQQQIVANARGLASKPTLLMIDEPTIGLSGVAVAELAEFLCELRKSGMTTILVEQNIGLASKVCDRFVIIRDGKIIGNYMKDELPLAELWSLF